MDGRGRRAAAGSTRGQTGIDYAIGMGVFLVAVVFIVAFMPSISQPFTSNQAEVTKADRVADQLSSGMLVEPETPYRLDETCTEGFFELMQTGSTGVDVSDCNFDTPASSLTGVLNMESTTGINVTVEETAGGIVTLGGQDLRAGEDPPTESSVSVTQRVVFADGEAHKLYVRVW